MSDEEYDILLALAEQQRSSGALGMGYTPDDMSLQAHDRSGNCHL